MKRRQHVLRKNFTSATPSELIFVDTEARIRSLTATKEEHRLRLGHAIFVSRERRDGKVVLTETPKDFTTIQEFWQFVLEHVHEKKRLYLFAHNWNYDAGLLALATFAQGSGWECTKYVNEKPPFILRLEKKTPGDRGPWDEICGTIMVVDTMNYFAQALAALGETIGLDKGEIADFRNASDEELMPYCRRDTQIIKELMLTYMAFVDDLDLGNFQLTLASQAFSAYRHRFYHIPIYIHDRERVCVLERDAYHGGRTEVFKQLGSKLGKFTKLDFNSLYPAVQREHLYPVRLIESGNRLTRQKAKAMLAQGLGLIARCDVSVPVPVYAYVDKVDPRLLFPINDFETALTTPELQLGLDRGYIQSIGEWASYEMRPIFVEWVDFFYEKRLEYKAEGNDRYAMLAKFLLNSGYGKWGQKNEHWEETGETRAQEGSIWIVQDGEDSNGPVHRERVRLGKVQRLGQETETENSFPGIAAHVTAYARMLLWKAIETARMKSVYYMDTDSLIVDQAGYERLERAGMVHESRLGALKVEGQAEFVEFMGPKDYTFGGEVHIKGVSKKAERIGPDVYKMSRFYSWDYLASRGKDGIIEVEDMEKHLERMYKKAEVSESGMLTPFRMER